MHFDADHEEIIRIISARYATPTTRQQERALRDQLARMQ
jgi:uncharacterized DUF497 family protein